MFNRRHFLQVCAVTGAIALPVRLSAAPETAEGRVAFRLKEAAGLRRFSYPVHAVLPVRAHLPGMQYRLLRDGKEIPAQFCELGSGTVALDFTASTGPFETENYVVEYGAGLKTNSPPARGLTAERGEGTFRIANSPHLTYSIPDDLEGFVSSIKTPKLEFLTLDSRGLFLTNRESDTRAFLKLAPGGGRRSAEWSRRGPFAVGLKFDATASLSRRALLQTTIDLTFVHSKSWIETTWTVEDPEDSVGSMGVDLAMKLDGTPALVDCGAGSTVYSHLRNSETLTFTGHPVSGTDRRQPRWMVEQGGGTNRKPFAVAVPNDRAPEGWIHLMDHSRCSALAMADFAVAGTDRFLVEGTGRIEFERHFAGPMPAAKPLTKKTLKFWLHVVPMPVQVGAVTSPQAMLAPLMVEWME